METNATPCAFCRRLQAPVRVIYGYVMRIYVFIFARPSMQTINEAILKLALHGRGFNNCCSPSESGEQRFIERLAEHQPRLCIDVGANKGEYSEALLKLTKATVVCFEPMPKSFRKLQTLSEQHPGRLLAINQGLSDRNEDMVLHYGEEDSVFASFSPEVNNIDYVGRANTNLMTVKTTTLDSFLDGSDLVDSSQIDLIKIDTEGFEYEVLVGAKNTIARKRPKFIQIEYNWHQLFRTQTLFTIGSLLPGYVAYQLLPHGHGLSKVDIKKPESNFFYYSNFVFVRGDIKV